MATMKINVPQKMKTYVEQQVAEGKYATVDDFIHDVVDQDQKRRAAIAEIQKALDEGEASGFVPYVREEFEARFEEIAEAYRLNKKNAA